MGILCVNSGRPSSTNVWCPDVIGRDSWDREMTVLDGAEHFPRRMRGRSPIRRKPVAGLERIAPVTKSLLLWWFNLIILIIIVVGRTYLRTPPKPLRKQLLLVLPIFYSNYDVPANPAPGQQQR